MKRHSAGLYFLMPVLAWLAAVICIQPWGDYPLNDDWQYARVAKRLAETGVFKVDVPVAPALAGQSIMAAPVIRLFGFSHTGLRLLTLALSLLLVILLTTLLRWAGVRPWLRAGALLVLLFNPLYAYLSLGFMTEMYGYLPALAAAALWFGARKKADAGTDAASRPLIGLLPALLAGLLAGAVFWTRQFCVVVFPALCLAALFSALARRQGRRVLRTGPALLAAAGAFAFAIAGYFAWQQVAGCHTTQFDRPLACILRFELLPWGVHAGLLIIYMTAFLAPLLLLVPWRKLRGGPAWAGLLLLPAAMLFSFWLLNGPVHSSMHPAEWMHPRFPFLGNIINDAGIGPVTLVDVYIHGMDYPRWSPGIWRKIFRLIVALAFCWPLLLTVRRRDVAVAGQPESRRLGNEIAGFGVAFCVLAWLVAVQTYKLTFFDRYYFPCLIGIWMATTIRLEQLLSAGGSGFGFRIRALAAMVLFAGSAWFTVAGLHDYFRWNDARWELYRTARAAGISQLSIQGGFEIQGWETYDLFHSGADSPSGITQSMPGPGWYCRDDSYRIGMNARDHYQIIAEIRPRYWLAPGPSLKLTRRPVNPPSQPKP